MVTTKRFWTNYGPGMSSSGNGGSMASSNTKRLIVHLPFSIRGNDRTGSPERRTGGVYVGLLASQASISASRISSNLALALSQESASKDAARSFIESGSTRRSSCRLASVAVIRNQPMAPSPSPIQTSYSIDPCYTISAPRLPLTAPWSPLCGTFWGSLIEPQRCIQSPDAEI